MKEIEKRFDLLSRMRVQQNKMHARQEAIREINEEIDVIAGEIRSLKSEMKGCDIAALANELDGVFVFVYNHSVETIRSRKRLKESADARRAFCHFFVNTLGYSHIGVARYLNRDHSTVLSLVKSNDGIMKSDQEYRKKYGMLAAMVAAMALNPETC